MTTDRRTEPLDPPFPVGFLVEYRGQTRMRLGDCPEWIEPGMVGEVVRLIDGMPAYRAVFGPEDEPLDGASVIQFHGLGPEHARCTRAVTQDDVPDRYGAA